MVRLCYGEELQDTIIQLDVPFVGNNPESGVLALRRVEQNFSGFFIAIGRQFAKWKEREVRNMPSREGQGVFARKGLFHLLDCHQALRPQ